MQCVQARHCCFRGRFHFRRHEVIRPQADGAEKTGDHQLLALYVAPALLGTGGLPAFAFPGPASVEDALRFDLVDVTRVGPDVRLEYEVPS